MSRLIDLTGKRFGRLLVMALEIGRSNNHRWLCECDCGITKLMQGNNLKSGHTRSCGTCPETDYERLVRFWSKVDFKDSGCWMWGGARLKNARTGELGYGQVRMGGKLEYAHRFAWRVGFGDPGSLYVLHRCDNPACVRLDHLFVGTHQDNMVDMAAKGRWGNQTRSAFHV